MSEDKELLDRIAKISGQINLHMSQSPLAQSIPRNDPVTDHAPDQISPSIGGWRSQRTHPYSRARGRAGRPAASSHRHRSLILNHGAGSTAQSSGGSASVSENDKATLKDGFVAKRDRHMQLINTSIYDKETKTRNKAIEETRRQKAMRRDQREKHRIQRHFETSLPQYGTNSAGSVTPEITLDGLRFYVMEGGSKLARVRGPLDSGSLTPKEANVGGVKFLRSKNGNMYRSGIVKARKTYGNVKKSSEPCKRFTSTGTNFFPLSPNYFDTLDCTHGQCPQGPRCPYVHDPAKVAMCKDFLQTGACPTGDICDLSHDPTPERVPACLHFLRGKCSNSSCRYAHVRVNPSAPVCKDFATVGYCGKGAECPNRHVHECPDYANTGSCHKPKCRLPHVDRAGQIKKRTANNTGPTASSAEDDDSDLVSDEEDDLDSEDVDSDGMEDLMGLSDGAASHALSQQQDYVHL